MSEIQNAPTVTINTNPTDNEFFTQDDYNAVAEDELSPKEMQEIFMQIAHKK